MALSIILKLLTCKFTLLSFSCLRNICDFPRYFEGASSALFDGLPTICGGRTRTPQAYYNDCCKFSFGDSWNCTGELGYTKNFNKSHASKSSVSKHNLLPSVHVNNFLQLLAQCTMLSGGWLRLEAIITKYPGLIWIPWSLQLMEKCGNHYQEFQVCNTAKNLSPYEHCLITEKMHGHCQVFLDGNTIFVAGGYNREIGGPPQLNTGLSH